MKKTLALLAALAATLAVAAGANARTNDAQLTGAGSTFVYPLISQWTPALASAYGYQLTYGPIGSGGGIAAITARTVDFGASDAPLTHDQFTACNGCVQIPWALSATSIAFNVPGAPAHLHLSGPVLADIFLGKISNWNDHRIAALNKGATLPSLKITPIFRSDSSGTTFNFTDYLSRVSPAWKRQVGNSTQVNFPTGNGAKGSSGVAGLVSRTEGGVTYVDVAYALTNHIRMAAIENNAGRFTYPSLRAIKAAAATVERVPANNELSIVDPNQSQKSAYPICTFTYVILPLQTAKAKELRRFVFWALTQGQQYGPKLLFQPIPKPVLVAAERTLTKIHA